MSFGMVAVAGAGLIGGMMAADGAQSAANTSADATTEATRLGVQENRRQFDQVRQLLSPYVNAGQMGLGQFGAMAGIYGDATRQNYINQIERGGEFRSFARQGENAILQNASATGGLRGGNTQRALADYRTNLLSSLIDKQMGRWGQLASLGQNAAAGVGNAGMAMASQNAGLIANGGALAGQTLAAGGLAGTNAMVNAVGGLGGLGAQFLNRAPAMPVTGGGGGLMSELASYGVF